MPAPIYVPTRSERVRFFERGDGREGRQLRRARIRFRRNVFDLHRETSEFALDPNLVNVFAATRHGNHAHAHGNRIEGIDREAQRSRDVRGRGKRASRLFGEPLEDHGVFLEAVELQIRGPPRTSIPCSAATGLRLVNSADSIRPIDADLIPSRPAMAPEGT